jgi:hypothetical protein
MDTPDRPVMMLFVDGLPYADRDAVIPRGWNTVPMVPSLGYSVNIEAELFAGLSPADLGWFGEWNLVDKRPRLQRAALRAASVVACGEHVDYLLHRLLERLFRERLFNLPLRSLRSLRRTGSLPYEDTFAHETLFTSHGFVVLPMAPSDRVVTSAAHAALASGATRLFVPLVELDGLTHRVGLRSVERSRHLANLNESLESLWGVMRARFPNALGIIVSDHGFVDVDRAIPLDVKRLLRRAGVGTRCTWVVDATLARFWTGESNDRAALADELTNLGYGHVLSEPERESLGVADRSCGDVLFVLDEGQTFVPCAMTKRTVPRAMHTYLPSKAQWGLAASTVSSFPSVVTPSTFYEHVSAMLIGQEESTLAQ